jgi:hypothetical protein
VKETQQQETSINEFCFEKPIERIQLEDIEEGSQLNQFDFTPWLCNISKEILASNDCGILFKRDLGYFDVFMVYLSCRAYSLRKKVRGGRKQGARTHPS